MADAPENDLEMADAPLQNGMLDSRYQVRMDQPIDHLSSDFAKAFVASDSKSSSSEKLYALVFDPNFPVRTKVLETIKNGNPAHVVRILSTGKAMLGSTKSERFTAILTQA